MGVSRGSAALLRFLLRLIDEMDRIFPPNMVNPESLESCAFKRFHRSHILRLHKCMEPGASPAFVADSAPCLISGAASPRPRQSRARLTLVSQSPSARELNRICPWARPRRPQRSIYGIHPDAVFPRTTRHESPMGSAAPRTRPRARQDRLPTPTRVGDRVPPRFAEKDSLRPGGL